MNEQEFKKLLNDTVRFGDFPDKDKLVSLLKIAVVKFEKTGDFTYRLWNHYKEYIFLCIIPEKMQELKKYEDYLKKYVGRYIRLMMSMNFQDYRLSREFFLFKKILAKKFCLKVFSDR